MPNMVDIRAGVCIVKDNKLLLLRAIHGKEDGKRGDWGPPGGHLELDETFQKTAVREAKEEAGIDVTLTGLIQAALVARGGRDIVMVLYMAEIKGKSGIMIQKKEVSEYKWVTKEEIENDTFPLRNKILKPVFLRAFAGICAPLDTLIQINL